MIKRAHLNLKKEYSFYPSVQISHCEDKRVVYNRSLEHYLPESKKILILKQQKVTRGWWTSVFPTGASV